MALAAFAEEVLACRACVAAGHLARANPIRPDLIDEPRIMMEVLFAIRRAGADMILSYFAKDAARLLHG